MISVSTLMLNKQLHIEWSTGFKFGYLRAIFLAQKKVWHMYTQKLNVLMLTLYHHWFICHVANDITLNNHKKYCSGYKSGYSTWSSVFCCECWTILVYNFSWILFPETNAIFSAPPFIDGTVPYNVVSAFVWHFRMRKRGKSFDVLRRSCLTLRQLSKLTTVTLLFVLCICVT